MKFIKAIFSLPFLLNILVGIALLVGGYFALKYSLDKYTQHNTYFSVPDVSKQNIFDAIVTLDQAGLKYEIDSFKYDPNFDPYHIFDVYPTIGTNVKSGRRIFIRANPKTWPPAFVPDLKDQYKNIAFQKLKNSGLKMGDTIYEKHRFKGIVLRMMYNGRVIKAGEEVPRFSKIDLVIGKELEKDVIMPSLTGLDFNDAKRVLIQNYFEVGRVDFTQKEDSTQARVYYQVPHAGSPYDQGETVDLWFSNLPMDSLKTKISELDVIYRRTIRMIDSTGKANYNFEHQIDPSISRSVRRQIETGAVKGTDREQRENLSSSRQQSTPSNNNSSDSQDDGITVE